MCSAKVFGAVCDGSEIHSRASAHATAITCEMVAVSTLGFAKGVGVDRAVELLCHDHRQRHDRLIAEVVETIEKLDRLRGEKVGRCIHGRRIDTRSSARNDQCRDCAELALLRRIEIRARAHSMGSHDKFFDADLRALEALRAEPEKAGAR
jgi:hypothetical protein